MHAGGPAGPLVDGDAGHHGVGPDLPAVRQGVRDVADQRARLGVDLASLQAESPVDAMRAVAEPAVRNGDRSDLGRDAQLPGAAQEHLAVATHRVRPVRVAVGVAPGPVFTRDRQFLLDRLVVRQQVAVAERPVGADPVLGVHLEIAGMEARRVAGVVHHGTAHAAARVVRAERHRVGPGDHPRLGPVQVMGRRLVAEPIGVRVPERPGLQRGHLPSGPGQPLQQHRTARPAAHDDQVDLVSVGEPPHVAAEPMVRPGAVVRQQPGRFIPITDLVAHSPSRTGSSAGWPSGTSNGSRRPTPLFL